ncbi:30S ribosomal protein S17 [Coprothermobacter platensis]|uniref:30S ribosomal protein S17 n=1 Tax=Coprothermobacter platensis TaxID=108819 RepID=UPI00037678FC|nr:30S ribosomal protein S17 [Coprothermobacter platensis]
MRRRFVGVVVSDKMDKTRVVVTERMERHPLYKKELRRKTKFYVHDEKNESKEGDTVLIEEFRPMSHLKRFNLVKVLRRKQFEEVEEDDQALHEA